MPVLFGANRLALNCTSASGVSLFLFLFWLTQSSGLSPQLADKYYETDSDRLQTNFVKRAFFTAAELFSPELKVAN